VLPARLLPLFKIELVVKLSPLPWPGVKKAWNSPLRIPPLTNWPISLIHL